MPAAIRSFTEMLQVQLLCMLRLAEGVLFFHNASGITTALWPSVPPPDRVLLRQRLIDEEVNEELLPALRANDLEGIADGAADAIFVILGTCLEYGIPIERIWAAVCGANYAKIDNATGKVLRREDGKILKPEGWEPPPIRAILEERRA